MKEIEVSVFVSGGDAEFEQVAQACELAGMQVQAALQSIHVLTGLVASDQLDALRNVPGVKYVELQKTVTALGRDPSDRK